jgi:hypothetical protein
MDKEVAAAIEKYTEVPAEVVLRIPAPVFDPDGSVPIADLETLQRFYQERGHLEYDELLDVSTFVDTDLAADVAAELDAESE